MAESSPEQTNKPEFQARSFLFLGINEDGSLMCEIVWGSKIKETRMFASMLSKLVTGELNHILASRSEFISELEKGGDKKHEIILNALRINDEDDWAVDPTEVEIV